MSASARVWLGWSLLAAALGAIAGITLHPTPEVEVVGWRLGLVASVSLANGILNTLLFVPLGVALGLLGRTPVWRWALPLSLGIELTQMFVPGRQPELVDIACNTLGAVLGAWALVHAPRALRPTPVRAARLSLAAGALAAPWMLLPGLLLQPAPPRSVYYGGWTPEFAHLEHYRGRVLAARLDGVEVPPAGRFADSGLARRRVLEGAALEVHAEAGPAPRELAPLVSVNDEDQLEVLLLGSVGDDLVYRFRTRAARLGLAEPEVRARGLLRGVTPGQPMALRVRRAERGFCLERDAERLCGLGFGVGRGWALLRYVEPLASWPPALLDALWLLALSAPFGYWARLRGPSLLGAALLAGALATPLWTPLLAIAPHEVGALLGGAALGRGLRAAAR